MEFATILSRVRKNLSISELMPLQKALADVALPAREIVLAPTGSGKTLGFAIPLFRSLHSDKSGVQALVIAPTRELVLQIADVLRAIAKPDYTVAAFYGGHSVEAEQNSIASNPSVIVATPGRLLDHLRRGNLTIENPEILVLDEYDKSLELGFLPDIKAIVKRIGYVRSVVLTSATELKEMPDFFGRAQFDILDYREASASKPDIEFLQVESAAADKLDTLRMLLADIGNAKTIVFVNHRDAAERVYNALKADGLPVALYHGGLEQDKRERALITFANGSTPILVSTDLASRGLDIEGVEAVVHYHLPVSEEAMTHRNGRTARMGASGKAFAIISPVDKIPDFFPQLANYWPAGKTADTPAGISTLYINAGKREKISRGDIVGFLIQKGGLKSDEVGKIDIRDHCAYVAVPASKADTVIRAVAPYKLKNTRVKVSRVE
ncbi:MAG: DEAD/DEAH box helicase [Bacteroidales bacterium]|nr:DEAD/DEAH box helicase [Bacteroidales bacterium]